MQRFPVSKQRKNSSAVVSHVVLHVRDIGSKDDGWPFGDGIRH